MASDGEKFRRTPCRFYQAGRCQQGDACTFKHIPRGAPRDAPDDRDAAAAAAIGLPAPRRTARDGAGVTAAFRKTRLCKFYEEHGACAAGDACRFAHGGDELRVQPASPPPAPGRRRAAPVPEWAVDSDGGGGGEWEPGASLADARPARARPPRTRRGAAGGPPPPAPRRPGAGTKLPAWAVTSSDEEGGRDGGKLYNPWYRDDDDDDDDASAAEDRPYASALGASRAARLSVESGAAWKTRLCKFWRDGDCVAGDACSFAHGADELRREGERSKGAPVVPPGLAKVTTPRGGAGAAAASLAAAPVAPAKPAHRMSARQAEKKERAFKSKLCHNWRKKGRCAHGDACSFAHGVEELTGGGDGRPYKGGPVPGSADGTSSDDDDDRAPPPAPREVDVAALPRKGKPFKGRAPAAPPARARAPAAALPATPPQHEAAPASPHGLAAPPTAPAPPPTAPAPASPPPPPFAGAPPTAPSPARPPPLALDLAAGPPDPPPSFVCPLTGGVMADPVVAADGYTYERGAVEAWLAHHAESPVTREPLLDGRLVPNHALRGAIAAAYGA